MHGAEGAPGFRDHFSANAARYAQCRPSYPPELAHHLASLAPTTAVAWDAGCGSGQLSVLLAQCFAKVIATDASAAQIAHAQRAEGVEYRVERAEEPSLPPRSVDLCVAAQAVHWFDVEAWHRAIREVARPGALVAMVGYGRVIPEPDLVGVFDSLYDALLAPYWPAERAHVESGYVALPFPWPSLPEPELAIERSWDAAQFCGYVSTWSSARAFRDAGRGAELDRALGSVAEVIGPGQRRWRWPIVARLGRVGLS
ncbi:MAG: class I SAM-dependent methyltransferase [Planctomycetota bacterium]